ncbi:copper chaperone CopZ [Sporosarcina sp. ACRSM]|uniref:copper chaperone CopZ n=1 Tax=Sporosarcina sp. ACRSM TaxID=2918216 RepID=UPI001EF71835|nr:copper chaperone CopZ [Sporosarcina sp. ACRSM]MCG7334636.1 copper chaperone CopZ [Sporosarcina sp. ACRSM]
MKEILKVEGMSCNHCVNAIETNVGELAGVSAVKVDLNNNEVAVEYDNTATLAKIKATIEDQGYDLV